MFTPRRDDDAAPWSPPVGVRRALLRFMAAGLGALLLVGVGTILVARMVSQDIAVRHAKSRGITFAHVVAGPLLDRGVRHGDPVALARFSSIMNNRLEDASMVHIKVWRSGGRIIWSDEPALRGRTFQMERGVGRLFSTGGAVASFSNLDKPENASETTEAPLLEVYAATTTPDGQPIIVESYWSTDHINADARAIMLRLAPLPIGALLLFGLVIVPLALLFARRVERAEAESARALQNALAASDLERRRIARDLHDGVLQDLSGVGYAGDRRVRRRGGSPRSAPVGGHAPRPRWVTDDRVAARRGNHSVGGLPPLIW